MSKHIFRKDYLSYKYRMNTVRSCSFKFLLLFFILWVLPFSGVQAHGYIDCATIIGENERYSNREDWYLTGEYNPENGSINARLGGNIDLTPLTADIDSMFFSLNVTSVSAFAIQPSCLDNVAQSDGYLQISQVIDADRFHWSTGSTFNDNGGTNTYANATSLLGASYPYQFNTGLSNADVGDFTIRVYNGADDSFTDVVVNLANQDCSVGCNCTDYLFVDDGDLDIVHKFSIDDSNGSLTEIGAPAWTTQVNSPHAVASDLNGNVYINDNDFDNLVKLNCNGDVLSSDYVTTGWDDLFGMESVNNKVYTVLARPAENAFVELDLCTGTISNTFVLPKTGFGDYWGLSYNENDSLLYYVNSGFSDTPSDLIEMRSIDLKLTNEQLVFIFDFGAQFGPTGDDPIRILGINQDEFNNWYIVANVLKGAPDPSITYIIKLDENGNYIHHLTDDVVNNMGFNLTWGLSYNKGYVYLSSRESCASVLASGGENGNMTYLPDLEVPGLSDDFPKAINIISECCPTNNRQVVNETLCISETNNSLSLNELFPCDGATCEGEWIPADAASTAIYNACNQTINSNLSLGCYSFTKSSDGVGRNLQCGAFEITFNLEVLPKPAAKIFALSPSCTNGVPNDDGYLQISEVTSGERVNWSIGSTYTGDPDYANAIDLSGVSFPYILATDLANPSSSQEYTIRVFSNEGCNMGNCFTDYTVTLQGQVDCSVGCVCNDYLYLAEPADGAMHKFLLDGTFPLPEIGSPWYGGSELPNPHGVATDINGFLYVGETNDISVDDGTNIRKLSCDGEIFSETNFAIDDAGNNFQSIGNTLYVTGGGANGIRAYDLCTGNLIGNTACSLLGSWELNYNKATDTFIWGNQDTGIYRFSLQELEDAIATGGCFGAPLIPPTTYTDTFYTVGDNFLIRTPNFDDFTTGGICNVWGITSDNNGNIYAAQSCASGDYTKIVKFDSDGQFVGETPVANNTNSLGYQSTLGIRYHAGTDLIYLANWQATADCVSAWDTDLTNYIEAVPPSGATGGGAGKAINILTECCPTNNRQVVDETICTSGANDLIFLNKLFPCDGAICEGEWIPADAASSAIFDPCNQTIIANANAGCYSFTKSSDGLGNNLQCGAFVMTFNLEVLEVIASVVSGDQTVCAGGDPAAFTVTTPASGENLSYQWQSSTTDCSLGFSDIAGATSTIYDPPVGLTDTTYYRLIVRSQSTNCSTGMCADTSNCITVIAIGCDFPDYEDTCTDNPCHFISSDIYMGVGATAETAATSNVDANQDTDDGVAIFSSLDIVPGGSFRLPVSLYNNTGNDAYLYVWVDWNGDGDFVETDETILGSVYATGDHLINFNVPDNLITTQIGLRFRYTTDTTNGSSACGTDTCATDGEVEDYTIPFQCINEKCLPVDVTIKQGE